MQERLGIAGSGAIACGLALTAARNGRRRAAVGALERVGGTGRGPTSRRRARSGGRRGGENPDRVKIVDGLDELVQAPRSWSKRWSRIPTQVPGVGRVGRRTPAPTRSCRDHHLVAVDRGAGRGQRTPGPVRRAARVQPGAADGAGRARVPGRGQRRHARRARALCQALGKTAVEVPDIPASSSTGCCSRTCSAVELMTETGMTSRRRQVHALARGCRWAPRAAGPRRPRRVDGDRRDDRRRRSRPGYRAGREGALGRKAGRGFYPTTGLLPGLSRSGARRSFMARRTS